MAYVYALGLRTRDFLTFSKLNITLELLHENYDSLRKYVYAKLHDMTMVIIANYYLDMTMWLMEHYTLSNLL